MLADRILCKDKIGNMSSPSSVSCVTASPSGEISIHIGMSFEIVKMRGTRILQINNPHYYL